MKTTENLLAIDIGNTSITYGFFKSGRLIRYWYGNYDIIPKINRFINKSGRNTNSYKVIICSVNPQRLKKVERRLKQKPWVVGKQIKVNFNHKYKQINKLGKDRLVNIYGVLASGKLPAIVLSFGTAITLDFVAENKVFLGGLIIPGIETSFRALEMKAALLPKNIRLQSAGHLLTGRTPKECMILGALQGFGAMVDGLIGRFQKRFGRHLRVIACGGHATLIRPYIKSKMMIDQTHTLKSLALIYKKGIQS